MPKAPWKDKDGNAWQQVLPKRRRGAGVGAQQIPSVRVAAAAGGAWAGGKQLATVAAGEVGIQKQDAIAERIQKLTGWIDTVEAIPCSSMAGKTEDWKEERKNLQAKRQSAKPREQRLREIQSNMVGLKKEIEKKGEAEAAADQAVEAAVTAVEQARAKAAEVREQKAKKIAKMAALDQELKDLAESTPAAEVAPMAPQMSKEQLAIILQGASPGDWSGAKLDKAYEDCLAHQERLRAEQEQHRAQAAITAAAERAVAAEGAATLPAEDMEIDVEGEDMRLGEFLANAELPEAVRESLDKLRKDTVDKRRQEAADALAAKKQRRA